MQTALVQAVPVHNMDSQSRPPLLPSINFPRLENSSSEPQNIIPETNHINFHKPDESLKNESGFLKSITENIWIKSHIPEAVNVLSIVSNGTAAAANMFGFSNSVKDFANSFGKVGAKIFLIINGAINAIEYFSKGNFLGALGHFNDIIVGSTVPHDHIYLDRGTASGTYTLANSLAIINNKDKFSSFSDHLQHIADGFKKSYNNFFSKDFLKNLANANNAMFGVASGIFCNLGVLTWFLTGNEKLGTVIRDFGGILMDIEQAHPGHLQMGRKYYFMSGLGLLGGTVSDFLAKMLPYYKKAFVPLSLCIDGIGRYLLRISHNRNELPSKENRTETPKPEIRLASNMNLPSSRSQAAALATQVA